MKNRYPTFMGIFRGPNKWFAPPFASPFAYRCTLLPSSRLTADTQHSTRRSAPLALRALLTLTKLLVTLDARGCSLYVQPTIIGTGTQPSIGVSASRRSVLNILLYPTGPYIRDATGSGHGGISLLAMSDQVHAWPGSTGGFKLMLNYAPGLVAQRAVAALGCHQLSWLLGETVTETGERHCGVGAPRQW